MKWTRSLWLCWSVFLVAPTAMAIEWHSSMIGIYGDCFEFCDFSVYKLRRAADAPVMAKRLAEMRARGKRNLLGLYCFDRVKYKRPIAEAKAEAEAMLGALDLSLVDAVFLSEENVPYGGGLDYLNQLYDHLKRRYPVPVFQWYSMPLPPHPQQRADGWIIDPYGFTRQRFRRYLMKYLLTGKPVVDCINASMHPQFGDDSFDQVEVCREFDIPMFFYAVDPKLGSPRRWLNSPDAELTRRREWVLRVADESHRQRGRTTVAETADYSSGQSIEIAGGRDNTCQFHEDFAETSFVDDVTVRGFRWLRWDGPLGRLAVRRRPQTDRQVELVYHFYSAFPIIAPEVEVTGSVRAEGVQAGASITGNGWRFPETVAAKAGDFHLQACPASQDLPSGDVHELWVRLRAEAPRGQGDAVSWDALTLRCRTRPPAERLVRLSVESNGAGSYEETFQSPKFWHLADIQGADGLEWRRGSIATRGAKGRGRKVILIQQVVADRPLQQATLKVTCFAHRSLGSHNIVGLSLDGEHLLSQTTTKGREKPSGLFHGELSVNASLNSARRLFIHLIMVNTAGVVTNPSNRFENYRLEVVAAP